MNKEQWMTKFQRELKTRTGLDLGDVDREIVLNYFEEGETPEDLVSYLMSKYDLNDISGV